MQNFMYGWCTNLQCGLNLSVSNSPIFFQQLFDSCRSCSVRWSACIQVKQSTFKLLIPPKYCATAWTILVKYIGYFLQTISCTQSTFKIIHDNYPIITTSQIRHHRLFSLIVQIPLQQKQPIFAYKPCLQYSTLSTISIQNVLCLYIWKYFFYQNCCLSNFQIYCCAKYSSKLLLYFCFLYENPELKATLPCFYFLKFCCNLHTI